LEIDAAISLFATKADSIDKTCQSILKASVKPIRTVWGVSNTPSALTTQTLIGPGPAAGRMWFVHRVVVLGADGHTAVSSALADVYAGPGDGGVDATSQIYSGLTIPSIIEEGRYHNPVIYGERVYAIFYNLPANQLLQFAFGVYDFPAPAEMTMSV